MFYGGFVPARFFLLCDCFDGTFHRCFPLWNGVWIWIVGDSWYQQSFHQDNFLGRQMICRKSNTRLCFVVTTDCWFTSFGNIASLLNIGFSQSVDIFVVESWIVSQHYLHSPQPRLNPILFFSTTATTTTIHHQPSPPITTDHLHQPPLTTNTVSAKTKISRFWPY